MEHIVFLTGRLAEKSVVQVLEGMTNAPFTWEVREIGLQVAALMTADMIRRRVTLPLRAELNRKPATWAFALVSPMSSSSR